MAPSYRTELTTGNAQSQVRLLLAYSARLRARRPVFLNMLIDAAKDGLPLRIQHENLYPVAKGHERRARLALCERLETTHLSQAAGTVTAADIGHCARANHRAGRQGPATGAVRDQRRKVKGHINPGVWRTDLPAIQYRVQRQVQLAFDVDRRRRV